MLEFHSAGGSSHCRVARLGGEIPGGLGGEA